MRREELNDFIKILNGRAAFYEFFMMAFLKPADDEFLDILKDFVPYFKHMATEIDSQEFKDGFKEIEEFVNTREELIGSSGAMIDLLDNLNHSYTNLFLIGANSIPSEESVYLSSAKLMKQEQWEEVIKVYYDNSFGVPKEFNQNEDHISSEFMFMFEMSRRAADALTKKDESVAEKHTNVLDSFLNMHILRWLPGTCDLIINTELDHILLYKGLAKLLKGYLYYDQELLRDVSAI